MIKAPHWQLKSHLKYIRTDGKKKSYEARFPVLMYLIMASNDNLRCYVGIEKLCCDTGLSNKPIGEALKWLESHGAIFNVAPEHRVGKECHLHSNKKVWQLTTVLQVEDQVIDYLYVGESSSSKFEELFSRIKSIAPDSILPVLDKQIHVQSTSKSNDISVQDTFISKKVDVQSTCKTPEISVQSTSKIEKIHVQGTRKVINNKIQVINKKEKDINNLSRYARPKAFSLLLKTIKQKLQEKQSVIEPATPSPELEEEIYPPRITDFSDKPYTQREYEEYIINRKRGISLEYLEWMVWNPAQWILVDREWYDKSRRNLSDWQKLLEVIVKKFPNQTYGSATKIAKQLIGEAPKGVRKEFNISPPMDATEVFALAYWLEWELEREMQYFPTKAETLSETVEQFRELSNHWEHVNHATYALEDMIAQDDPPDPNAPKPDDTPADPDELAKIYAEAEALLGFSLTGD